MDADPWCGLALHGTQLLDADGTPAPWRAALPPLNFRGYRALPADGGQVVLLDNATWGLAPSGLASGAVIEWDGEL